MTAAHKFKAPAPAAALLQSRSGDGAPEPRRGPGQRRGPGGHPLGTGPRGVFYIRGTQAMYTALEVLERLGREGRLVLKARGQSIPTAVAVANIITGRLVQGSSRVENVQVDSEEIRELGGVMSTIEITLAKTGA